MDFLGIGIALVTGLLGNKAGKSEHVLGDKPVNKLLAPITAVVGGVLYTAVTGAELPIDQVTQQGAVVGGQAVLTYTLAKNGYQFIKSFF